MSHDRSEFRNVLTRALIANTNNFYGAENWDSERFGAYEPAPRAAVDTEPDRLLSPIAHAIDKLAGLNRPCFSRLS
jgi:hypothetical protein